MTKTGISVERSIRAVRQLVALHRGEICFSQAKALTRLDVYTLCRELRRADSELVAINWRHLANVLSELDRVVSSSSSTQEGGDLPPPPSP